MREGAISQFTVAYKWTEFNSLCMMEVPTTAESILDTLP